MALLGEAPDVAAECSVPTSVEIFMPAKTIAAATNGGRHES
jgi:hypothetical protein